MPADPSRAPGPLAAGLLALLAACAVIAADLVLFPGAGWLREGGGVETASALLYLGPLWVTLRRPDRGRIWPVPLLLAAMALRELDFDKRFTTEGLLGLKVFSHDTAPSEKALAALVIVTLAVALVLLLRRHGRRFLRALAHRRPWALWLAAGLALAAISKSLDGLGRKLGAWGIDIAAATNDRAGRIEEVLELGLPVLLLMAAIAAARERA